jgi:small subunit ribosomal protein S10
MDPAMQKVLAGARLPKSLQALFNKPLRRKPTHGIPVCDLQIRSFNVRNLELFADFAMRAAYYMNLVARGPVPLPRMVEKWTVPKSNFVHKKSQENFNRITVRRLIQIQDGNSETVQAWLGYLQKRSFAGVGMKANLYEWEELGVSQRMDEGAEEAMDALKEQWGNFSIKTNEQTAERVEKYFSQGNFENIPQEAESFYRRPVEVVRKRTKQS